MKIKNLCLCIFSLVVLFLNSSSITQANSRAIPYYVNSNTDVDDANIGDGICATPGGYCTLRAAIREANSDGVDSTIQFTYSFTESNSINLGSNLPPLTENNTSIDASNHFIIASDRPGVNIVSSLADYILKIDSNGNTIRGILFGGAPIGIKVTGDYNTIGGSNTNQRNVLLNTENGVFLSGYYNIITSNYFGTVDGESVNITGSGDIGILADSAHQSTISDNLIVGYTGLGDADFPPSGITMYYADDNYVENNIIGMNLNKSDNLGNQIGIYLEWADNNSIGSGNVIAGNTGDGIYAKNTMDLTIFDNEIGYHFFEGSPIGVNGGNGILLDGVNSGTEINNNIIQLSTGSGVWSTSNEVTILGNHIYDNGGDGIYLTGNSCTIGSESSSDRNTIGINNANGIHLNGSDYTTIRGNAIGIWDNSTDAGNNGHGILIENGAHDNIIGGGNAGEGNWIGFNLMYGIRIQGATTYNNAILGNVIGAPMDWSWEAGNGGHGIGIYSGAHNNRVGSSESGEGNEILSSGWSGVVIVDGSENVIEENHIGVSRSNLHWSNRYYGIVIQGPAGENQVNFNMIAYNGSYMGLDNGQAGIKIDGSVNNMISRNSIYDNDGPGILLVNSGNNNITRPVITSASCEGPISGNSGGNSGWVQIFSDNSDEGRIWEGTTQANADGSWSWPGMVSGPNITATVRSNTTRDTSAFSIPFYVGPCHNEINLYLPMIIK